MLRDRRKEDPNTKSGLGKNNKNNEKHQKTINYHFEEIPTLFFFVAPKAPEKKIEHVAPKAPEKNLLRRGLSLFLAEAGRGPHPEHKVGRRYREGGGRR